MGSLERKLARRQQKETKKFEKKMAKQIMMFENLPDNCLTCNKDYDKKNKEQVMSWRVVIRGDRVNLYCPECWENAIDVVKGVLNDSEND